ncbi:MAG: hypothetical protein E7354_04740 [Clostridiales bacterium]|nr:hypothetical protein [Clostridiales bacterium]
MMKDRTKEIILNELKNHQYSADFMAEYNLDKLFNIYCTNEIETYADLIKNHGEFVRVVIANMDLMDLSFLDGETMYDKSYHLRSLLWSRMQGFSVVNPVCYRGLKKEQDAYVSFVNYITSKRDRVLDVGPGRVPLSSIMIASDREDGVVGAMDWLALPDDVLKRFKVKGYRQQFRFDTKTDDCDIVVANKACDAFPAIVSNCSRSNKAYFMKLCDCFAPGGEIKGWHDCLREFDSRIKFDGSGYFATNLDMTPNQFDKALKENGCMGG